MSTPAAAPSALPEAPRSRKSDTRAGGDAAVRPRPSVVRLSVACFALSGFVSMAYEVIWLRHLTFFFRDTIYLYTGIVTMFVFGIGAGGLLGGRSPLLRLQSDEKLIALIRAARLLDRGGPRAGPGAPDKA